MASNKSSLITLLDPPALGPPHPAYSNISIVALSDTVNQINIAGQVAWTATGETPEGLAAQMKLVLSRISTCLEATGATVHDMSKFMYYFTEEAWTRNDGLQHIDDIVLPWLQGSRPASCCMIVKSLSQPEFLCEFEATAVVRRKDGS